MSSKSKKNISKEPQRDSKGRFVAKTKAGEKTRFAKDNDAASKYDDKYCDQIIEFFNAPLTHVEYKETLNNKGMIVAKTPIVVANEYPTFELFAAQIGVSVRTLLNWSKEHPRFSDAYARAKEIQFGKLTACAVAGLYNPLYAKFEAINNHGQRDRTDTVVANVEMTDGDRAMIERVIKRLDGSNGKK